MNFNEFQIVHKTLPFSHFTFSRKLEEVKLEEININEILHGIQITK